MTKTIAILITKILNQRNLFLSWLEKKKIEEDPPKNPFFMLNCQILFIMIKDDQGR